MHQATCITFHDHQSSSQSNQELFRFQLLHYIQQNVRFQVNIEYKKSAGSTHKMFAQMKINQHTQPTFRPSISEMHDKKLYIIKSAYFGAYCILENSTLGRTDSKLHVMMKIFNLLHWHLLFETYIIKFYFNSRSHRQSFLNYMFLLCYDPCN